MNWEWWTERFLSRQVVVGDCVEYTGRIAPSGYGAFSLKHKTWAAHRIAWVLFVGPIPNGALVFHSCNNRKCVKLAHLYIGTHQTRKYTKEDFYAMTRQTESGCLEFTGKTRVGGYGAFASSRKSPWRGKAHRAAWYFHYGSLPPKGMVICHNCHNRVCVRVDHLRADTQAGNMDDVSKNKNHPARKFTPQQAAEIKLELRNGDGNSRAIARRLGVDQKTVRRIEQGKTYRHD